MNDQKMAFIDISQVTPSKTNPRKDFKESTMKELIESVREKGILQPVLVRPLGKDEYELVCGERRFRAAKKAGLKEIPAIVRDMDDKTSLEVQLIENMQRSDVHPLEEAEGYEQLIAQHGYAGAEQIAAKVGKSKSYIYGCMRLLALVEKLRKFFYEGRMDKSIALLLARIPESMQEKAAKDIGLGEDTKSPLMSYKMASDLLRTMYTTTLSEALFDIKDGTLLEGCGACSTCPHRSGNQHDLFGDIESADICTNPPCFQKKIEAHYGRIKESAELSGRKMMSFKDCKKSFRDGELMSWMPVASNYVDLNSVCEEDPKERKYMKLIDAPSSDITDAMDDKGAVHHLINKDIIKTALSKAGHKFANKIDLPKKEKELSAEEKQKQEEERILFRKTAEIRRDMLRDAVRDMFRKLGTKAAVLSAAFVDLLLEGTNIVQELSTGDVAKTMKKIKIASDADKLAMIVDALVLSSLTQWASDDEEKKFAVLFGVDLKKIKAQAVEEAKKQIEAEKKAAQETDKKAKKTSK
jgi:ParB/RepB/Spo0J family partition protein